MSSYHAARGIHFAHALPAKRPVTALGSVDSMPTPLQRDRSSIVSPDRRGTDFKPLRKSQLRGNQGVAPKGGDSFGGDVGSRQEARALIKKHLML
jgi:hypothetical protein